MSTKRKNAQKKSNHMKEEEEQEQEQETHEAKEVIESSAGANDLDHSRSKVQDTMAKSRACVAAAKADTTGKVYRVYCDGVFDVFHLGHMRMLEQAKKALGVDRTYLICGVHSDQVTNRYKGKTVMDSQVRYDSVRHCKWVDEVVEDAPWVVTKEYLTKLKLDFVAHDDIPYNSAGMDDIYACVKQEGKFLTTQRTEGISTSDIIIVLLRDYDAYVRRNLERGYSPDQMNVGRTWFFRARQHEMERKVWAHLEESKKELVQTTSSIVTFVKQFDPRSRLFTQADEKEEVLDISTAGAELVNHAYYFFKASFQLGWAVIQLFVPLGFLCSRRRHSSKNLSASPSPALGN
eukprot:gb/GEZN01010406.1/.p1 GENE.gb/GEZN01010406.1/~~gb/GEZN01010406.1/.p1  ORF type:complete len:348 (+),score=76.26 gb/GEZN01010406.1/:30-1073(+)